ncbi:MAG: hypothetical protein CSB55_07280 [Candidatus Cloacimonadota bacterium]|nr:MAG: hypothetical protein CSB55_07280 [Candidatus Cloacimonadota bacterium]
MKKIVLLIIICAVSVFSHFLYAGESRKTLDGDLKVVALVDVRRSGLDPNVSFVYLCDCVDPKQNNCKCVIK